MSGGVMGKEGGLLPGALACFNQRFFFFCIASRIPSLGSHQELSTIPWSFFLFLRASSRCRVSLAARGASSMWIGNTITFSKQTAAFVLYQEDSTRALHAVLTCR